MSAGAYNYYRPSKSIARRSRPLPVQHVPLTPGLIVPPFETSIDNYLVSIDWLRITSQALLTQLLLEQGFGEDDIAAVLARWHDEVYKQAEFGGEI